DSTSLRNAFRSPLPAYTRGMSMKVFFSQASSKWAQESGYAKKWESFVSNLKQEDHSHSITDNRRIAERIGRGISPRSGNQTEGFRLRSLIAQPVKGALKRVAYDAVSRNRYSYDALLDIGRLLRRSPTKGDFSQAYGKWAQETEYVVRCS